MPEATRLAPSAGLVLVCSLPGLPVVPNHMPLKTLALALAILLLYALHQDVWFWRSARPLLFGFLPVGLAYHGAYCLASALLMWTLTRVAWPHHLEDESALEEGPGR